MWSTSSGTEGGREGGREEEGEREGEKCWLGAGTIDVLARRTN